MRVFKFGGASVKDATGVKNLTEIVRRQVNKDILIVVSAMGKTTNALELVISDYLNNSADLKKNLEVVRTYHQTIISELFEDKKHSVYTQFERDYKALLGFLEINTSGDYDFVYDQIIGFGELFSTRIVSAFLEASGLDNTWLDVRQYIKTNASYRRAAVDWQVTKRFVTPLSVNGHILVTQGFLGSDAKGFTTTLGREGSDYSAAILAGCLQAESVTIWKDVPGVLNADPRYFEGAQLLNALSYNEAIELAFYGASVIHPKTLQPLQNNTIPLYVKSFLNPEQEGTKIAADLKMEPEVPCFILKQNQILISLSTLDFSYIVEENISDIFKILHLFKMKVDLIQNSAISFSVCVDDMYNNIEDVIQHLSVKFKVDYIKNVTLYTVRHYTADAISSVEQGKSILLKQRNQHTLQIVTK